MAASPERIRSYLIRQVALLDLACLAYDSGQSDQALTIAMRLRVLFHDTGTSVSITESVDIKRALKMYDSGTYEVTPGKAHSALTWGYGDIYLPCFDDFMDDGTRIFLPFERWWARKVISDAQGHKFSRRRLVLALAGEEGGAPVTPGGDFGIGDGPWHSVRYPVPAAVREMGYEALISLARFHDETFCDDRPVARYWELRSARDVYGIEGTLIGAVRSDSEPAPEPTSSPPGRNKPCPCGSGLKFKLCCGR